MYDRTISADRQTQLAGIANRIQAAGLLMQCIGRQQQDEYRPICDTAAFQMNLYAESVRLCSTRLQGLAAYPSISLSEDMDAAGIAITEPDDLLDEYASNQLNALVSAIAALQFIYLSASDRFAHMVGRALCCCIHWIEVARREIVEMLSERD